MSEWMPIETAPKDGSPILIFEPQRGREFHMPQGVLRIDEHSFRTDDPRLVFYDDRRWSIGYWRPWGGWGNRNSADVNPTHWMPLPAPPSQQQIDKDG